MILIEYWWNIFKFQKENKSYNVQQHGCCTFGDGIL